MAGWGLAHIEAMAERVGRLGWHLQIFAHGADDMLGLLPRLRTLPVDVVIDHIGLFKPADGVDHPGFQGLLELVRGGRCWVKLSAVNRLTATGPPYADVTPFASALIELRPDRMLWATDWPHVQVWDHPMPQDADLLDWVTTWDVDETTQRQILADNPGRLYGFD